MLFLQKNDNMLSNTGVRYGLLGGVAVVFYLFLMYALNPAYFLRPELQWSSLIIYGLFMWQAAKVDVAEQGLSRDFREILRTPFVAFLLINLCYWTFYYALHLYDPSLLQTEMVTEITALKAQIQSGLGDPQQANAIRERIVALEESIQSPSTQPLGPIINRMFIGALGGFVLASGVAVIFRSRA